MLNMATLGYENEFEDDTLGNQKGEMVTIMVVAEEKINYAWDLSIFLHQLKTT